MIISRRVPIQLQNAPNLFSWFNWTTFLDHGTRRRQITAFAKLLTPELKSTFLFSNLYILISSVLRRNAGRLSLLDYHGLNK